MECARCGTTNRDGARFCVGCGDPLQPRCSSCDAELPFGARFCDTCGAPVDVARPAPDTAASRRTVTILFSDLTGSTALGERMDPESVRALMAPIYAAMRSEVETRGGHVSKFVGDGVMAVFGIPEVHEDDAMRALDTAVGMQQALDRLAADVAREHGAILQLKVGVNTGEIVVGAGDEDIVGDCVNVASRLEGAAAPGEILVGEDTWRLTRSMATYEPVAPLSLKGKSGPVPAYRLASLEQTTEARTAMFVGRDTELARLLDVFEETVDASASRLVSIVGSPGLGKTRLARELGAALVERALVVETRCDPGGSATFAPVADALRTTAAIAETATPDEVTAAIAALVPDEPDRDRIVARAAALLGTGEPGSVEETFWAIRRIVEVAARVMPLVLVLDDLHWGEPLLLDLVEHLAEWNRSAPILLVVTGRPELRQIRPALTEGGRASAVIALEGLDGDATGALACGLLGTDRVPAELLARLPESTEGNPLFVREFVRMLVDEGVLRRSDGAWTITVDVDAIQVPPTIQSLLSARVDRLDPPERTVLELASVVGKEFYRGAVHDLAPAAVRVSLDAHLESLRRKEFVEPAGTYWIDEPVFRFHHVLIRDAAYRRLLKEARADLHERVASWLESKTADVLGEHDELIGYHYEQAHESLRQLKSPGAERDEHAQELERKAALRLSAAARSALDRDDIPAAAALSRRALERLDLDNPDRAQILIVHCEALLAVGDLDAANDPIQELEHLAEVASDKRLKAWATCFEYEWRSLVVPSRLPELEERIGVAIDDLRSAGDLAGVAKAYTVHATVLASLGRVTECEVALDAALTAAREAGDRRRITDVLGRAMTAALWGPSPVARAGGRCLDLVRLSRITTNPPEIEATSLRCQAVLEAFRGRADAARRMLGSARRSLEELGRRHGLLQNELFAGIVELTDGDAAAAEPHLRAAYEGLRAMSARAHAARAAALLARSLLVLGREGEADAMATESESLAGADLKAAIAWRGVRAEILARRGSFDEARRLAQAAVGMAAQTEALIDHGDACLALAAVCLAAGDTAAAERATDQARSLYERKGATVLLGAPSAPPEQLSQIPVIENECTSLVRRVTELFMRRDWGSFAEAYAPDCSAVDRRVGLRGVTLGRDAVVEHTRVVRELSDFSMDLAVVATRGTRLALVRQLLRDEDSRFEADFLQLAEADDQGRMVQVTTFDVSDVASAIDELDERFLVGEGAPFADTYRLSMAITRARNARDWDAYRDVIAEDAVLVDHRGASLGVLRGADAMVTASRQLDELMGDTTTIVGSVVAIRDGATVSQLLYTGSSDGGGEVEIAYCSVLFTEGGRIVRQERFPPDRLDLALARFLDGEGRSYTGTALENACTRHFERMERAFQERRWSDYEELVSDDLVQEDLRVGLGHVFTGRQQKIDDGIALAEAGATSSVVPIAIRGERLALFRARWYSARLDPDSWEVELLFMHEIDDDGQLVAVKVFDASDLSRAIDELDERFRRLQGETSSGSVTWNRGVEVYAAWRSAFLDRDWTEIEKLIADDVVFEDRRSGLRAEGTGRDAFVQQCRVIAELGLNEVAFAPVAVRGAHLVLLRTAYAAVEGRSTFEAHALELLEVDAEGKACRNVFFDEDDLDAAIAELDARYAAGEGSIGAACIDVAARFVRAFNARDWDALRSVLTPDFELVDRRPAALGTIDADEIIRAMRVMIDLIPGRRLLVAAVHALAPQAALTLHEVSGQTADGASIEEVYQVLWVIRDGRLSRLEQYHEEKLDLALARFEELRSDDDRRIANLATRALDRAARAYAARDWDGFGAFFAQDCSGIDRRRSLRAEIAGRAGVLENMRAAASVGAESYAQTPLAVRGERLALSRLVYGAFGSADGFEVEIVQVTEVDDSGRITGFVVFEADDLHSALAELDQRFVAGEGSAHAEAMEFASAGLRAMNERDWDAYGALMRDDMIHIDHRPASLGEVHGADEHVRNLSRLAEVLPGAHFYIAAIHAVGPDRGLIQMGAHGTTLDGDDLDASFLGIYEFPGGLCRRIEQFRVEELAEASRRFEELRGTGPLDPALSRFEELRASDAGVPDNGATRVVRTGMACVISQDWDGLRQLFNERAIVNDTRAGLGVTLSGVDAILENFRAVAEIGVDRMEYTVLATRGDRLVLGHERIGSADPSVPYETELISMHELNDGGRVKTQVLFDPDDLDAAFAELDERYLAGEGTEHAEVVGRLIDLLKSHADRDWARFASLVAEGFVLNDHRPASLGRIEGREAWMESHLAFIELVPDVRMRATSVRLRGPAVMCRVELTGTNREGGSVEQVMYQVGEARGGQLASIEIFPLDRYDAALAYFEERGRNGVAAGLVENAATRACGEIARAFARRDWVAFRRLLAEDHENDDRRRGLTGRSVGGDRTTEVFQLMSESLGLVEMIVEVVATRGERLGLVHGTVLDERGNEIDLLLLNETDDAGRLRRTVYFDDAAIDAAFDELDARYLAGESAPFADAWHLLTATFDAHARRDREGFGATAADDFVAVDHRPASLGRLEGRADYVEWIFALMDVMPDSRLRVVRVHAIDATAVAFEASNSGTNATGGGVEIRFHVVWSLSGGLVSRAELFPLESLGQALARYGELTTEPRAGSTSPGTP